MNPRLDELLSRADEVMEGNYKRINASAGPLRVGVDLGTAYTVLAVLDKAGTPVGGDYRFAQIVRDGLVVDFVGAVDLLRDMKAGVEAKLGVALSTAATAYPPGVAQVEVRATANVLRAAGFDCSAVVDEPTAANAVLGIRDGAVVDVGGGTTGVAVFKDGQVVYTADEPTGGTHFSLVVAGALDLSFERAEDIKKDPREHARLFPIVRPVMEKVGTIVARHIAGHRVDDLYLVGGTCAFAGIDGVIAEVTGVRTHIPGRPLFVTPLGIAMHDTGQ